MSLSIHPLVQDAYDFYSMRNRFSKENYMTTLGKPAVARSNSISACCNLGCLCQARKGVKHLSNILISLNAAPLQQRVFRDLSQIGVRCA